MIKRKFTKGFTLIELMVTISIMIIILSVSLYNYSGFNDKLALSSAGQEMAIAIREAQVYGVNVKEADVGARGNFNGSYGIYFNPHTDPTDYVVFADTNGNGIYEPGSGCGTSNTECLEKDTLRNGITIAGVCDSGSCPGSPACATYLVVTFHRPSPDANINFYNNSGAACGTPSQSTASVHLVSPKNVAQDIVIKRTGQVLAQ